MSMDERKNRVLQAIISDYVATAEPVGSRTIARKYRLGVSPATIRNEMADLEELGYIEQPHTSAGRVPSDRGYRYYVDCLMEVQQLEPAEQEKIRHAFERRVREVESLARETARLLSETTHLTSVIEGPQLGRAAFKEIHLVPMSRDRALLVYMTDTGFVENTLVDLPVEITMLELQRVGALLSEHLRGISVEQLNRGTLQELHRELRRYGSLLEQALEFLQASMQPGERQRIWLSGATNLLSQPEFRDVDKARLLLGVLEQEPVVSDALAGAGEQVAVQIGEEIKIREMQDCSIITATYRAGDKVIGRIGVIGPKRMDYGKVIGLVNQITERMSETLERKIITD